ncbi:MULTISPECIES: flavoprotein [unclassified Pseudofrankia]|uniref:flavoprotein n=1 Tax=unclassified Pseudofrankia TaxID=2994372 RepID=UPI0008DA21E8|nr:MULTISPECIES: flavoprotein [unclassified Pseudofrankia]MDT3439083.1 flavoprotein [Pseudofrankia sp. BMG5.37]OHV45778.1 flavoprotein [Pseudofrankia sp. BMG5.36]
MARVELGVLYVLVCGGQPAREIEPFVERALAAGWDVCVVATPAGMKFLDAARLAELTGHPVRSEYKRPEEPDVLPPADAFVVAPATFNTVNKLAAGISDTLVLGLVNEGLGAGKPILLAPFPNRELARHPAFAASLTALRSWGVRVLFDGEDFAPAQPDAASAGGPRFPWDALTARLSHLAAGFPVRPAG